MHAIAYTSSMPPGLTCRFPDNTICDDGEMLHIEFAQHTRPQTRLHIRMSKIAIISQPDQGVLIDLSGCSTLAESLEQLSTTLLASSQFWKGVNVSFNLGELPLEPRELGQVLAIAKGVGIAPVSLYSASEQTRESMKTQNVPLGEGTPMTLPAVPVNLDCTVLEGDEKGTESTFATLKVRVKNAIRARRIKTNEFETPVEAEMLEPVEADIAGELIEAETGENRKIKSRRRVTLDGKRVSRAESDELTAARYAEEINLQARKRSTEGLQQRKTEELSLNDIIPAASDDEDEDEEEVWDESAPAPLEVTKHTLYLKQTLRSGQTVSHKGHLFIIGDVNAGAEIMAEGDITVWGSLRGIAHAGIGGNLEAEIRALSLEPIQIRIANAIARGPDKPHMKHTHGQGPEVARLSGGKIKVVKSRLE